MANSGSSSSDPFDSRKLKRLAELMNDQDLSEIFLQQGAVRIRLRRQRDVVYAASAPAPSAAASASSGSRPAGAPASAPPDEGGAHIKMVKSPMVGTFYSAPNPESPAFVKVGDPVGPETTVCIIEAMKVFNEIPAEVSGKIVAVLVESGEPVEFGQPLFKVDTRQ